MIYGYVRVSAKDQNEISQIAELKSYGVDEIVSEKVSGVSDDRKLIDLVENKIKKDDVLVVLDVTRFGRSLLQSVRLSEEIKDKGANLIIRDLGVDTRTAAGQLVFSVMAAMSEFERLQAKERQRRGIEFARKNGVHLGKKAGWKPHQMEEAVEQFQTTSKVVREICARTGVTRSSLYRELKKRGIRR